MKTNKLLKNIFMTYNHSSGTQKSYVYALKQYCSYFGMDLHEFLREAEDEETGESNGRTGKSKADFWNSVSTI